MTGPPTHPLHRRLKAARFLAGYPALDDLIEHIPGIDSRGPLAKMETGRQTPTSVQLAAWARACGLSPDWFFVDFAQVKLPEPAPADPLDYLEQLDRRIAAAQAKR